MYRQGNGVIHLLAVCLSACLSVGRPLSVRLFACPSIRLSDSLPVHQSAHPSVFYLPVRLPPPAEYYVSRPVSRCIACVPDLRSYQGAENMDVVFVEKDNPASWLSGCCGVSVS